MNSDENRKRGPLSGASTRVPKIPRCLRHSSIVRSLIAGTPTRVVAALHDTSTVQLERVYSAFIADHADTVARRGLIDTSTPTPAVNVVTLPAGW